MQLTKKQLQRQQIVMAHLGFYKHKCDGIWGPESIIAKRKFEAQSSFVPALPTNGLPFGEKEKYPKGMRMGVDHLFTYSDPNGKVENNLTEQKIKQLAGNLLADAVKPVVAVPPTVIPKEENAPLVTSTEVIEQKEVSIATTGEPEKTVEVSNVAVATTNQQPNDTSSNYNKNNTSGYKGRR